MARVSEQTKFEHDGETYLVGLSVNALCALEEELGDRSITKIGEEISSGRAGARGVRALFRAALIGDRPEITLMEAGRLVDALGPAKASEVLTEAFDLVQAGLAEDPQKLPKPDARGRLSFEAAGERFTLVFGMNAQAELEDYFNGLSPEEIARKFGEKEITLRDLRAMLRASLVDDRDLTLEQAGETIDRIGLRVAGTAIAEAFVGAFPEAASEMVDEEEGNRRSRRAAASRKHPTKKPRKGGTGRR